MNELLVALALWLTTNGIPVNPDPKVVYMTQEELQATYYGPSGGPSTLGGVYYFDFDSGVGTIHLLKDFDPTNKEDQAILLHELVHHHQGTHQLQYSCQAHYEAEAYYVEQLWRRENNLRPSIGPITIAQLFMCISIP